MKILLIGGTSFYGKLLVEKLLAKGHKITVFSRGNTIPENFKAKDVYFIKGDRNDHSSFPKYFKDISFDVVYDNMAMNGKDVATAILAFSENTKHYVLCSSVAIYPDWKRKTAYRENEADLDYEAKINQELTETEQWLINYGNGKRQAEKALVDSGKKFPYTIIRPAVIQGENDPIARTNYWVQRLLKRRPLIIPTDPHAPILQHIYSDDLANLAVSVIESKPQFKAYNVAGDDSIDVVTYIKKIATMLSINFKDVELVEVSDEYVGKRVTTFPAFFDQSLLVDSSAAKKDFSFAPTNIEQWLQKTVDWCKKYGQALHEKDGSLKLESKLIYDINKLKMFP